MTAKGIEFCHVQALLPIEKALKSPRCTALSADWAIRGEGELP
ncbi:MAG: hypothetical protein ACREBN_02670 [Burkholderiaceae bacterium]